jgi:hypothetical protein
VYFFFFLVSSGTLLQSQSQTANRKPQATSHKPQATSHKVCVCVCVCCLLLPFVFVFVSSFMIVLCRAVLCCMYQSMIYCFPPTFVPVCVLLVCMGSAHTQCGTHTHTHKHACQHTYDKTGHKTQKNKTTATLYSNYSYSNSK